jgi:hypothetical protein
MPVEKTNELRPPPMEIGDDAARVLVPHPEATQEVRLEDVLETIDLKRGSRQVFRSEHPTSIAPIAIDVSTFASFGPEDSLDGVKRRPPRRPPSKRLVATVACAMGLCVVILGAAGVRTLVATGTPDHAAAANALTIATPAASTTSSNVDVANLPPATVSETGTIVFPRRTTATLDGARVTSGSAIVRCGEHTIRLGRGTPRKLDVPCGGTIAADGTKAK